MIPVEDEKLIYKFNACVNMDMAQVFQIPNQTSNHL